MSGTHVVFRTAGETFALPIEEVRKVRPLTRVTRIPGTPPYVAGAMNDEGSIVTLIDLAVRLGGAPTVAGDPWVVLLAAPQAGLGILVEEVHDVVKLEPDDGAARPPDRLAALAGQAMRRVPDPLPEQGASEGPEMDDAEWLRYTLTESAHLMGYRDLPGPRGGERRPEQEATAVQWRLDIHAATTEGGT